MLGAIAGQGGFTPIGKTPKLFYNTQSGSTGTQTHLSITGKGLLTGISMANFATLSFSVIIDGVTLNNNTYFANNGKWFNTIPFFHRFESSLVIQSTCSGTDARYVYCSYLLD